MSTRSSEYKDSALATLVITVAHKIQLDPTNVQATYFAKACGTARFARNWALGEWQRQYKAGEKPSEAALRRQLNASKDDLYPWMAEVTKCAPQQGIKNLGVAFRRFFQGIAKYPKFKKKGVHDSFRADNGPANKLVSAVDCIGYYVDLPRIGKVKMHEKLRFLGRIISVTVSSAADRWFASFSVEIDEPDFQRENQASVGVDLGILDLAILSDGTRFENPKALRKRLVQLKRLSRGLSRKVKGSSNRKKARMKLAKLHYRIACIRKDALHKLTTFLVKTYSLIGVETLNVRGMLKNARLARAIADVGMHEFMRQLTYKAIKYGSQVVLADRWFPSSKTCSECGCVREAPLSLAERRWTCSECDADLDRDVNAAMNLKMMAESYSVTACGEESAGGLRKKPTKLTSAKQEPSAKSVHQVLVGFG